MVETMPNRLHVGGADATQRMDSAILQIMDGSNPAQLTGDLRLTAPLLQNALDALDALDNLQGTAATAAIRAAVAGLSAGDTAATAAAMLPADSTDVIEGAISDIALADAEELEVVNATIRQGGGSLGDPADPGDPPPDPPDDTGNTPPQIGGAPAGQVLAGNWYDFQPEASDADNDELSFSIQNRPDWLSFDAVTGRLSGFPGADDVRRWESISISVSDGTATASLAAFDIAVLDVPNSAPTIFGEPRTSVAIGESYNFQPSAFDADGDELVFVITNMPAWANFNTATGTLYGVPDGDDAGSSGPIQIGVTDGTVTSTLPTFSISVSGPSNTAPVISGSPTTQGSEGTVYSFRPTASDADGDTLTFSIDNLPAWASFNTATGRLYGVPGNGDAGSYTGIRIHVSDGIETVSMESFAINVSAAPASSGDVVLNWIAPTENVDGTALTDLAGYKLYFGRTGESLTESRVIENAQATSYLLEDLGIGSWRFVMTAVDQGGHESRFSDEATISIN
jgi:hypothetical protein